MGFASHDVIILYYQPCNTRPSRLSDKTAKQGLLRVGVGIAIVVVCNGKRTAGAPKGCVEISVTLYYIYIWRIIQSEKNEKKIMTADGCEAHTVFESNRETFICGPLFVVDDVLVVQLPYSRAATPPNNILPQHVLIVYTYNVQFFFF